MPKISDFGSIHEINKTSKPNQNCTILDLTNLNDVKHFIAKEDYFDVFIFFAGLAHSKGSNATKDLHIKTNYKSLKFCIDSMKKYNKVPNKIIFASTISVYGEDKKTEYFHETTNLKPVSPYAVSKVYAEKYLVSNFSKNFWILRFAPVYCHGFYLNIHRRTKINNIFYKPGNGQRKLSLCNILNISLVVSAILKNNIPSGIYNLSDDHEYTYNDLLKKVGAINVKSIPYFIFRFTYMLGKVFKINFLIENYIKLLTDNLYPSKKIQKYVSLDYNLFD